MNPKLIVFGGRPGVGKTTLAQAVARTLQAAYLRIDVIEQALRDSGVLTGEVGPAGYLVAYALAESQMRLGISVVADSVNPLTITRVAWRRAGASAGAGILEIEVVCSDEAAHRQRLQTRVPDIAGLPRPDWGNVMARDYEPWDGGRLIIDTARMNPDAAVAKILSAAASEMVEHG